MVFIIGIVGVLVYGNVSEQQNLRTQSQTVTSLPNVSQDTYAWYNITLDERMHGSSEVSVTLNNAHNTKATTSTSTIPTANITIQTSNTANGTAYTVLTVYDSCPKSEGANLVAFQQANCTYQPWRAYISEEEVNPTVTNVLSLAPIIGLIIVAAALLFFVTRFSGGSGL